MSHLWRQLSEWAAIHQHTDIAEHGLPEYDFIQAASLDEAFRQQLLADIELNYLLDLHPLDFSQLKTWEVARTMLAIVHAHGTSEEFNSLRGWFARHRSKLIRQGSGHTLGRIALQTLARIQKPSVVNSPFWLNILESSPLEESGIRISGIVPTQGYFIPQSWKRIAWSALVACDPELLAQHICRLPSWFAEVDGKLLLNLWQHSAAIRCVLAEALQRAVGSTVENDAAAVFVALHFALPPQDRLELTRLTDDARLRNTPQQTAV